MQKKFALPLLLSLTVLFSTHVYSQTLNFADEKGPPVTLTEIEFAPLDGGGALAAVRGGEVPAQIGTQRAPAPPLTRVAVYAVGSSNCGGWEFMTTIGQLSTTCDHGGAQLRAVVQEIGYGGSPFVWMNGSFLPSSANYLTESICIVGSSYVFPCSAGGTAVGWMKYYNLDGYQSGTFKFQDTSINSPWNTIFTQIYIQ